MVFIHVIRGRPSGLVQFPAGEAVKICFASVSSGILKQHSKNQFYAKGFSTTKLKQTTNSFWHGENIELPVYSSMKSLSIFHSSLNHVAITCVMHTITDDITIDITLIAAE